MIERKRHGMGEGRPHGRLDVYEVRRPRFRARPWRRGGLDPSEVYDFLERAADEIDLLHRELVAGQAEIERLRVALHHWQTWHRHCGIPDLQWPINHEPGEYR
ncbi:DivIVA domain-containing protein [Plantactinospora sp. GCM10030261]|uniref:DivIVA domain-containing protein n=1 Tax=Plantactinospora sp. GCM10030261 TaxID=3273420 RepID=UPI00361A8715